MTLRLILMRHGKSDWTDDDVSDHARVLNKRGRAACDAIGDWLAQHGALPDQVLCSDAARTAETWARIAPHLPGVPAPDFQATLYLASAGTLFSAIQGAQGATLAVVAHNPGIGDLASLLCAERPTHARFRCYPTLATLIVDFDIAHWSDLAPQTGQVAAFIVPRDLTD
jgi:phosphohistidine phosphatase